MSILNKIEIRDLYAIFTPLQNSLTVTSAFKSGMHLKLVYLCCKKAAGCHLHLARIQRTTTFNDPHSPPNKRMNFTCFLHVVSSSILSHKQRAGQRSSAKAVCIRWKQDEIIQILSWGTAKDSGKNSTWTIEQLLKLKSHQIQHQQLWSTQWQIQWHHNRHYHFVHKEPVKKWSTSDKWKHANSSSELDTANLAIDTCRPKIKKQLVSMSQSNQRQLIAMATWPNHWSQGQLIPKWDNPKKKLDPQRVSVRLLKQSAYAGN